MAKTLQEKNFKKIQLFPVIGILFLGISLFSGHFYPESTIDQVWGHKLFKPSPFFILGVMGFSLIGIPLLEILLKRFAALRLIIQKSGLVFYSYGILWIYLLTTIIGYYVTTNIILEMLQPTFSQAAQLFIFFLLASLTYSYFIGQRIYRFKNRAS